MGRNVVGMKERNPVRACTHGLRFTMKSGSALSAGIPAPESIDRITISRPADNWRRHPPPAKFTIVRDRIRGPSGIIVNCV